MRSDSQKFDLLTGDDPGLKRLLIFRTSDHIVILSKRVVGVNHNQCKIRQQFFQKSAKKISHTTNRYNFHIAISIVNETAAKRSISEKDKETGKCYSGMP